MGRHKEFNRQDVLDKAMVTFWRQGYEGTSIRTLIESMGIHRGSLYDTFGDKHSLFEESLARYDRTVVEGNLAPLQEADASLAALGGFFESVVDWSLEDSDHKGCLLVNTAAELAPQDPRISQQLRGYFHRIEATFASVLERSRQRQELTHPGDISLLAKYLLANLQGLRLAAKLNPNRQTLQGLVDITLSTLTQ
ncbi:TetR/AcrR family transcriptional regulator [Sodalinema gerasimenkoae]|uniref:TetR/AcrR family transcriptional regulator n=1 Tax=Sodalinema gerasimenkoae TaxID=2862348 RepID=UPI00135AE493|nr:TetR/AcrR family transcriptional regulator [Sodalinema gerasimenkoae]